MPSPDSYCEHRFGAGAPWLDLLATRGYAAGAESIERLPGLPELTTWLEHERLTPEQAPTVADVERVRALRETLRAIVLTLLDGEGVTDAQVGALQPWLDHDGPLRATVVDGRPVAAGPPTLDVALARLCRAALEGFGDAGHLRVCAGEDCHMIYLDPTGRRRWCSAERCGVKARVRAHRARARTEPVSRPAPR